MNANEVVANRALEHLGHGRGEYAHLHPIDDVNRGQSTNDVYPTAVKVALHWSAERLLEAMGVLRAAFAAKADEFMDVVKVGRTQLQDAVPMTLGQEFTAYAVMIGEDERRLAEACRLIEEVNLGGTAIGTRLNAPAGYCELACRHLGELTGIPLVTSPDLVEATQDPGILRPVLRRAQAHRRQAVQDLQRPAAAVLRPAGRASTRSTCRRCRPAPASCPARSTRSSRRWSTRSPSRSSATTSP